MPRLTSAWLAQLGARRSAGGVMSTSREVGDKGRQSAACRILALSFYEVGDYFKSIESSKEELAIAREVGNRKRQDKTRQCFIWSLIQSYVYRLYPNNSKS